MVRRTAGELDSMAYGGPEAHYDYLFKLLLLGDTNVGKTTLLVRYVDGNYEKCINTIGVDFKIVTLEIGGQRVKLQLWDTAGQERFRTITTSYYRGAHGILVLFALDDVTSFLNVRMWLQECNTYAVDGVKKLLVGTKCDVAPEKRLVTQESIDEFVAEMEIDYVEVSALTAKNFDVPFTDLAATVLKKYRGGAKSTGAESRAAARLRGSRIALSSPASLLAASPDYVLDDGDGVSDSDSDDDDEPASVVVLPSRSDACTC